MSEMDARGQWIGAATDAKCAFVRGITNIHVYIYILKEVEASLKKLKLHTYIYIHAHKAY